MSTRAPLGHDRFATLEDRIVNRMVDRWGFLIRALLADGGVPAFHDPLGPREQYEALIALRQANSPQYWSNPAAVKRLEQLIPQFGPPPAPATAIPPYPTPGAPTPVGSP